MARLLVGWLLMLGVIVAPAMAQSPKIFVASTGDDANPGTPSSPKRSLQAAHAAVAAGGGIVLLDTAGYGLVFITKSVAITAPPGVNGFVTTAGLDAIRIAAGVNDTVTINGLILEGNGTANGIKVETVGTLVVNDTIVRNFNTGILMNPTTSARLVMHGGALRNSHAGLIVEPLVDNVTADAIVTDVSVEDHAGAGLEAYAFGSNTYARLLAVNCIVTRNGHGFEILGPRAEVAVDGCVVAGNTYGFFKSNQGTFRTRQTSSVFGNDFSSTASTPLLPISGE